MHYNDVTGNALVTKPANDQYRTGWDAIFGKKETKEVGVNDETSQGPVGQSPEMKPDC